MGRTLRLAAVVGVVPLVVAASIAIGSHRTGADAPTGPAAWPFRGDPAVATAHRADAIRTFRAAGAAFLLSQRARHPLIGIGTPHAVFAQTYHPRVLDVVVLVAPVTNGGTIVGYAGLYGQDRDHHGVDAVEPMTATDEAISGDVRSYVRLDNDPVTVVVGGPLAAGLLVNVNGGRTSATLLDGAQVLTAPPGRAWMYSAVPLTEALQTNGVMTVTNGAGDAEHPLYYGRPAAVATGP